MRDIVNSPPLPPLPSEKTVLDFLLNHRMSRDDYKSIVHTLHRAPTWTELGMFSALWSEHCSYKSSKKWLKRLPTSGDCVVCGPGENAGVVDIGDNQVVVFKMESHNHPSFLMPFHGAATGVGGVLRDIFTMGARPIALLDVLRFGSMQHFCTPYIMSEVVRGISHYGNCIGVPTVGGETQFGTSFNHNNLVNVMCVGLGQKDKIFYARASGVGNLIVYVGAKTGRDGIHGASMASGEFTTGKSSESSTQSCVRPKSSVQVGDPFYGKILLEACLELMMQDNGIVAIQDMGAAGLTSASVEMIARGQSDLGAELVLDNIPLREKNMHAHDIMLSESQERMLMIIKKASYSKAQTIFDKWDLDFCVIGHVTNTGCIKIYHHDFLEVDVPIQAFMQAPELDRPYTQTQEKKKSPDAEDVDHTIHRALKNRNLQETLLAILFLPDICSKRSIFEQYDHTILAATVCGPEKSDAAIVRVHGTQKALALSVDCTSRYCHGDSLEGAKQAVAECWRNISASGARPLAVTDCLNFGSPDHPDVMKEFIDAIEGIKQAAMALDFPVVSGNVSFYNETDGASIFPTPEIGGVGLFQDYARHSTIKLKRDGDCIVLLSSCEEVNPCRRNEYSGHMQRSVCAEYILGIVYGVPPTVHLEKERAVGDFVRSLIENGILDVVHDVSDGGILVALTEMVLGSDFCIDIVKEFTNEIDEHIWCFNEDQSRYIISIPKHLYYHIKNSSVVSGEVIGHVAESKNDIAINTKDHAIKHASLEEKYNRSIV